ncbi:SAM-dependent methyltransferase [Methanocalculus alkaliphilus]|uniref:class I SAM-dependent methyltransferase n=1 Tax=Methanocalculus alkaliphilus TaxID=768730 RepID=UPI0020A0D094|nr:class I SAM-dependent methyltransferase [Methanocalculus alkaliphilus]MCP1714679.1 SAM-dependent methyltransferase [Methanocalculus alkaliphilus]
MGRLDPGILREAWNTDYRKRGALYGGVPFQLPDLPPKTRILDLGCGNGKHLPAMEGRGWAITGLDAAEEAVRLCRRRNVDLIVGDGCHLPFREGIFGAVIGIHILGHLTVQGRPLMLGEVQRVLEAGGAFHCTVFSRNDMRCGKGEEVEPFTFLRQGIITHYFTEEELRTLGEPFEEIRITRESHQVRLSGECHTREYLHAVFSR